MPSRSTQTRSEPSSGPALSSTSTARSGVAPAGEAGRVFTKENGETPPRQRNRRFIKLCARRSAPSIRLHDLRHSAATLSHAAGAASKDIQEMLGHSSIAFTAYTYTSLLPDTDRAIARPPPATPDRSRSPSRSRGGRCRRIRG
ncbi:tyrosine-type recombinase/integrase [Streptomyces sioyaensis]|uniref:tyrosine-type recombinase/integrase n=1 Tax=Streptomyces sioyaensis TaxID=67364 RepID=UPI003D744AB8